MGRNLFVPFILLHNTSIVYAAVIFREKCSSYEMFNLRHAQFMRCSSCEVLDLWDAHLVRCSVYDMLNLWDAQIVSHTLYFSYYGRCTQYRTNSECRRSAAESMLTCATSIGAIRTMIRCKGWPTIICYMGCCLSQWVPHMRKEIVGGIRV